MYEYKAGLVRVLDGDTVVLSVDLGFNVGVQEHFRLSNINAPELHGHDPDTKAAALESKKYLEGLLAAGPLTIRSERRTQEKFGRYLVRIVNGAGVAVNEEMVKAGHAKTYEGGKR